MERNQIDVKVFLYPPFSEKSYKKLLEFEEFKKAKKYIDVNKFIDYVILMYDINSPLRKEYPFTSPQENVNYSRRKFECARLAGFELYPNGNKKEFDAFVSGMLVGENEPCNDAILKYILQFGMPELMALISFEQLLIQETKTAIGGSGDKETIKNIDSLYQKIRELTDEIYYGRETLEAKKSLYMFVEREKLNIFPEDVATMIEKTGKLPKEWSPDFGKINDEAIEKSQIFKQKFLGDSPPNESR
jgi:hypothetical protein